MSDQRQTSPPEAELQPPPFAPHATYPDDRASPPAHPRAEAFVNATAQHVFPERPGPKQGDGDERDKDVGVTQEGRTKGDKDEDEQEDEEQQPILIGTPLDEMKTPVFERGMSSLDMATGQEPRGRTRNPPRRQDTTDTIRPGQTSSLVAAIPEGPDGRGSSDERHVSSSSPSPFGAERDTSSAGPTTRTSTRARVSKGKEPVRRGRQDTLPEMREIGSVSHPPCHPVSFSGDSGRLFVSGFVSII